MNNTARIHIAGHRGMVGSALVRRLQAAGYEKEKLGWTPTTTLAELVKEMVEADYAAARRDSVVKLAGFQAYDYNE